MSGEEPTIESVAFAGLTLMGRRLRATADSSARLATIRLPPHDLHAMDQPVLAVLVPLIERGQRDGTLRPTRPPGAIRPRSSPSFRRQR